MVQLRLLSNFIWILLFSLSNILVLSHGDSVATTNITQGQQQSPIEANNDTIVSSLDSSDPKKDLDYSSVEEDESNKTKILQNEDDLSTKPEEDKTSLSLFKLEESSPFTSIIKTVEKVFVPTTTKSPVKTTTKSPKHVGHITDMLDIVRLVRFVFLRGHIVLDASHRVILKNESRIERIMDYLHDIQLRRGKHRLLPMEDRDLACNDIPDSKLHVKELCKAATFDCLSASEMIQMLPPTIAFHQAITRICPLLLFRQSRPICVADIKKLLDDHLNKKIKLVEPSIEKVWGFGVLFVTISIVFSMGGLIVLPFLKKSSRMTILTFFEGLAVGGLAGSAVLHLFPQAFDIVDEKYRAYFWNTFSIFLGIYIFYCIEMGLKIWKSYSSKNRRKRVPSVVIIRDDDIIANRMNYHSNYNYSSGSLAEPRVNRRRRNTFSTDSDSDDYEYDININNNGNHGSNNNNQSIRLNTLNRDNNKSVADDLQRSDDTLHSSAEFTLNQTITLSDTRKAPNDNQALISSTREQLAQCLSSVNVMPPPPPTNYTMMIQRQSVDPMTPTHRRSSKERMVPNVALRRQDHETSNIIVIDTVAWMIVIGDALLNFIDGLSIGAAFDRNILAGMSISVAVMLEEVTHRLGTFAVLIRSGMSMKQSFLYIFLSGCACYPGLALGIFLSDEAEEASPYIFALAGGFFLYMALVDVMKAMNRTMENASRKNIRQLLRIWALQNLGIVLAAISLALLAFYEKEMDFERAEIAEIEKNSFV